MARLTLPNGRIIDTDTDEVKPEDLQVGTAITPQTVVDIGAAQGGANPFAMVKALEGDTAPVVAQNEPAPDLSALVTAPPAAAAPAVKAPKAGGGGAGPAKPDATMTAFNQAQGEMETAAKGATEQAKAQAGVAKENADAELLARQQEQQERLAHKEQSASEFSKLQAQADAEDQKYKSMGYEDFWSRARIMGKPNTATGARILGLLSVALGTAGASLTKGPNYALEQMNNLIAQDYQLQKDAILKQRDVVNAARGRAAEAKAEKLLALENWRKNAYETIEAEGKAKLAAMGPQAAEAKGASVLADLHAKAIESAQALKQGQATLADTKASTALKYAEIGKVRAEGAKEKALTSDQSKNADLAGRMLQDASIIDKVGPISPEGLARLRRLAATETAVANSPKLKAALIANGTLKTPEQVLNEHDQLAYGARRRFAASVLRGDSGAAISLGEYTGFDEQNFEQIGEKPASAAAKKLSRDQMIQGKLRAAGPGAAAAVGSVQQLPIAKTLPPGAIRGTLNGKRGYVLNGQFVEDQP